MEKIKHVTYISTSDVEIPCQLEYVFHDFYDLLDKAGLLKDANPWDEGVPFKITIETMGNRWGQPIPEFEDEEIELVPLTDEQLRNM